MKKLNPPVCLRGIAYLLVSFTLFIAGCGTFPKGVRALKKEEYEKADKNFERSLKHPVYGPSSLGMRGRITMIGNNDVLVWIAVHQTYCEVQHMIDQLPVAHQIKLRRYDASRQDVRKWQENLQKRIISRMSTNGTIEELLALEENSSCWSDGALDSLRAIIVNKTIDPFVQVFDTREDENWESRPWPPEEMDRSAPGRACWTASELADLQMTYPEVTTILNKYPEVVLPANYGRLWRFQSRIWELFQRDQNYCTIDSFVVQHSNDLVAKDCWMQEAQSSFCSGSLRSLLAFFRDYPHTVIDVHIANQILCLATTAPDANNLNEAEGRELDDIIMMSRIQDQLLYCDKIYENEELIDHVEDLARRYKYHLVLYDLARLTLTTLASEQEFVLAKKALDRFQPLFPDTVACPSSDYVKMRTRQQWFDHFAKLLKQTEEESVVPIPVKAWNTPTHDESGLVSWGETNEVFFIRYNPGNGERLLMTSKLDDEGEWTEPVVEKQLSAWAGMEPFSMSSDGKAMLLRAEGRLFVIRRGAMGRRWGSPEEIEMHRQFAGNAWLSPDDSLLFAEYYVVPPTAAEAPQTDIGVSELLPNGLYGRTRYLDRKINQLFSSEDKASVALGGRLFFYNSNRPDGVGLQDMYTVSLSRPLDWTSMSEPRNLGLILNTPFDDSGITYFSEYTGNAYFHRREKCDDTKDIYQVKLAPGVFPENAMRLAGLVLDETGKPVDGGGGFIEFTADYNLHVHSQPVSAKGTYSYTVRDSTEVVRLYPEIPGYYTRISEEKTHFLAHVQKGEIIRDTFTVISFDYIRHHFKLEHSTFFYGTDQFDQPDKAHPEINELARIATRMGANLVLHGHTDNTGTIEENMELSIKRTEAVKDFLVKVCGFAANRISTVGYGATVPICSNSTEEGRRCNRRIEIKFEMPELIGK
jgi:outer membrane protein OmpA-like peptidoglycan-associated protein